MATPTGPLHLAAAIDGVGQYAAPYYIELARLAEGGTLDFVTLDDTLGPPGDGQGRLDALAVLARVAPATERIGLVPTVTTTYTEPFHVSSAVATLDWVSRGRAGWTVEVSATEAEARLVGRRPAAPAAELWAEAGEVADVSARLWDSWEDDAEIRDTATGRFVDRDKLHYVDYEGAAFRVRGPAIVPRPPQGHPVVAVAAADPVTWDTAARHADVAYIRATDAGAAGRVRDELRRRAVAYGRDPGALTVLAALAVDLGDGEGAVEPAPHQGPSTAQGPPTSPDRLTARDGAPPLYRGGPVDLADLIAGWQDAGAVDGFHITPVVPRRDLERFVNGTVALLQHRGLFRTFYPGTTLREHLGRPRPANRYARAREAAL
ncbi:LLM class flavin-dependent oxidoreductase [Streptomyces botrytidirepellens]|uniref:LLM class flavin-dependent oxidoreductase n=1 Tax=Streptomyces botrytidirepellens TaxID=2486417 RepID=A0A3M8SKA5_9ACTN|nr:LLM class flavin-dependent oxidoreductase [Streptomyces botrytidirepellens]RNF81778.1 LLM class flavin-dependent oxidoreductase [Streptomyces botrytidirepellens]